MSVEEFVMWQMTWEKRFHLTFKRKCAKIRNRYRRSLVAKSAVKSSKMAGSLGVIYLGLTKEREMRKKKTHLNKDLKVKKRTKEN